VYARVSSEQQAQAGTIGSQLEALRRRVAEEGLAVEAELEFVDEGYSGATLIRPALERLRDMAAAGSMDRLYVHSPDRLARKYAYQVLLVEELNRCAVEVVFLNHGVGDSPEDSLLLQVQGMVAEYERAKIMERCRRGKLHAARKGLVNVLSGAPYGYRYLAVSRDGKEAQYQIVLEEAKVVRQVFQWVGKEGCSIGQVRKRLHEHNISAPRGKSWWDRATVWGMLKNPAYKGQAAFGKTRVGEQRARLRPQRGASAHPHWAYSTYEVPLEAWTYIPVQPIVGESLFATVQERLAENRKRSRERARGARHLLQGLLVCARCGYAYYGKPISLVSAKGKKRSYVYYRCTGTDAYRFAGQRICSNRQLRSDLLEQAVWRDVCSLLSDPARIEEEYHRRISRRVDEELETATELRSAIQKLRRGISRLIDSYQGGLVEKAEFEPRMRTAREKLKRLQTDLRERVEHEQQDAGLQLVLERMREFAEEVGDGLANADWATRRAIIRAVVKEIRVDDQEVRIVYKVAPDHSGPGPHEQSLQYCWGRDLTNAEQHLSARSAG
jgi:site-specific DNA recombinase